MNSNNIKQKVYEPVTSILVHAVAEPGVPDVVTPVVYSDPELCVPSDVSENLNGCPELELSS